VQQKPVEALLLLRVEEREGGFGQRKVSPEKVGWGLSRELRSLEDKDS